MSRTWRGSRWWLRVGKVLPRLPDDIADSDKTCQLPQEGTRPPLTEIDNEVQAGIAICQLTFVMISPSSRSLDVVFGSILDETDQPPTLC